MPRLVLHIGSHKTGTTTLQKALRSGHRDKRLGNWNYLHVTGRVDSNSMLRCRGMGPKMTVEIHWDKLESLVEEGKAACDGDFILSSEMFFWLYEEKDIQKLADLLLRHFAEVKILAYLRRQDQLALSHRKQVAMGHAAYRFYGAQVRSFPVFRKYMMQYFDYSTKLEKWERAFGKSSVRVRRFEPAKLSGGDTVKDFWSEMGLPEPPKWPKHINKAWNRTQILSGLWLRQRGYPHEAMLQTLETLADAESMLPSENQARAFQNRFHKSNQELAARYDPIGIDTFFDKSFEAYPVFSNCGYEAPRPDFGALEKDIIERMETMGLSLQRLNPADRL